MWASGRRVLAMVERYAYLMRGSWPRMIELIYWPAMQIILWGFISEYLQRSEAGLVRTAVALLAGVLLWDVLFRGQLGVSVVFFEELYSRNLGHLFASPLRPTELAAALLVISFLRTLLGAGAAALLALWLYHYSIFALGLPLLSFFMNLLVMGWAIGLLVAGLVLRFGLGAENLAWAGIFAIAPLCGIYYPVSILPMWLQPVARILPASYVFHGMRQVLFYGRFDWGAFVMAAGLNAVYLAVGIGAFLWCFRVARTRGTLLNMGE